MMKTTLKLRKQNVDLISITPELIGMVRQRPVLWDTSRSDFYDLPQRAELWREIAREIFSSEEINAEETEYMSQLIKLRWRNVRTSYVRYLKRCPETRPEYVYESEMSFYTSQSRSTYDTFNPCSEDAPRRAKHRESSPGDLKSEEDLNSRVTRSQKRKAEKRRQLLKKESQEDDRNGDQNLNNGVQPEKGFDDDQCFFDSLKPFLRDLTSSEREFFQTNVVYKLRELLQS